MEITLLIMENHGIVFLNFCGNPVIIIAIILNHIILNHFMLKGDVGGCALNSHGNYIVDHGKSWNCVFEFLWEPCNHNSYNT